MIVAFTGYAGSGKDTAADILVNRYGFIKVAFADALRQMAWDINPIVGVNALYLGFLDGLPFVKKDYIFYQDAIHELGYREAKKIYPEVRRFLQQLGTDGCRKHINDNIWIDLLLKKINWNKSYAISDLRFPNEQLAVHAAGGIVIRINRVEREGDHPSEIEIDNVKCDFEIDNYGTIEELELEIERALGKHLS